MVTKAIIGNQIPNILPITSSDALANHTAKHTNQLQPIALIKATVKGIVTLPSATAIALVVIAYAGAVASVGQIPPM